MKICLITPAPTGSHKGNRITALRWASILRGLGHRVIVTEHYTRQRCDVLIAVIGPRWMDLLAEKAGERDYVREEIAAALRLGIVVIPVRVGQQGRMPPLPRQADLPEDIRDLVQHQKHDVVHENFGRDMDDLLTFIAELLTGAPPDAAWRKRLLAALGPKARLEPGTSRAGIALVMAFPEVQMA